MDIRLTPPRTAQPLLAAIQQRTHRTPSLSDFPALALAATATKAELDPKGETFAAVQACVETLARLRLSVSSTWLLTLLAKHGPQQCAELCQRMKISSPAMTGLITRLESLALISVQRGTAPDRRAVIITATEPARKVLASLMALTALGAAAAVLTQPRKSKPFTGDLHLDNA